MKTERERKGATAALPEYSTIKTNNEQVMKYRSILSVMFPANPHAPGPQYDRPAGTRLWDMLL